ncbi:hypothetical protein IT575_13005 [bacterium]|nr:hypothetical protein [bacterium]
MRGVKYFSWYGAAWVLAVLIFGAGVFWMLNLRGVHREAGVPLDQLKLDSRGGPQQQNEPPKSIDEQAAALQLGLQDAQLSITSADGSVSMTLWADEGEKDAGSYRIKTGALLFSTRKAGEEEETVLIRVTDASFVREAGTAKVRGTLTGRIYESDQYFTAQEIYWDKDSSTVTAHAVRYIGPSVEVSGSKMRINLQDKSVVFEGPVEAGI